MNDGKIGNKSLMDAKPYRMLNDEENELREELRNLNATLFRHSAGRLSEEEWKSSLSHSAHMIVGLIEEIQGERIDSVASTEGDLVRFILKSITPAIKMTIQAHGPIDSLKVGSLAKRIRAQIRQKASEYRRFKATVKRRRHESPVSNSNSQGE